MLYVQVELRKNNNTYITWIEKKKGLRVGSKVTLEPEGEVWVVVAMYSEIDKAYLDKINSMNGAFGASLRKE